MIPESLRRHPLCFVEDLAVPVLSEADRRHLTRALRLEVGDRINVSDGAGSWVPARLTDAAGRLAVDGSVEREPPSGPATTVAFTPTKWVRSEWVVQRLTELGIDRIGILRTERSVVHYRGARAEKLLKRLERVVVASSKQSRRTHLPTLTGVVDLTDFVALDGCVFLADPHGQPWGDLVCPADSPRSVAIGPEGGWAPAEAELAPLIGLPGRVLRADTAALAAGLLLLMA